MGSGFSGGDLYIEVLQSAFLMLFKEGDKMSNPALANTLQKIADHGADAFYKGPIADSLVKAVSNTMILL